MNNIISKNQHTFPKSSLDRFVDERGNVFVKRLKGGSPFPVKTKNRIFCVNNKWDQRAEKCFSKNIEDKYQSLTARVLSSKCCDLSSVESEAITTFYALWAYRSCIDDFDYMLQPGIFNPQYLSENEKLKLESLFVSFIDETGYFSKPTSKGIILNGGIISFVEAHKNMQWKLVKSPDVELIIPDNPANDLYIPVTPNFCFLAGNPVKTLSITQAQDLNLRSIAKSVHYFCGKRLEDYG